MFKKIKILLLTVVSIFASATNKHNVVSAKAEGNSVTNKIPVIYTSGANSPDVGFIYLPVFYEHEDYVAKGYKRNIIFGFDSAPNVDEVVRIHFRLTYRTTTWWDDIRNAIAGYKKHGTLTETTMMVDNGVDYSYFMKSMRWEGSHYVQWNDSGEYANPERLNFKSIGLVADLLRAEAEARNKSGGSDSERHNKLVCTGGYTWRKNADIVMTANNDRINDSSKSFSRRKYYAIIPLDYASILAPESIKAYDAYGNVIADDGLDNEGNPYVDPETNERYVETKLSRDWGVAINGTNAILKRIVITGVPVDNNKTILIRNADVDKESCGAIVDVKYSKLFNANADFTANWEIDDTNRYVHISHNLSEENATNVRIRFYYDNSDNEVSYIINVTDENGCFLPPGAGPDQPPTRDLASLNFKNLLVALGILAALILVLALAYDLLKQSLFRRN